MTGLNSKYLVVNLSLLRSFKCPISILGIHSQVTKLQIMGLIRLEFVCCDSKDSGIEKYYILSQKGQKLLELFPEDLNHTAEEVLVGFNR
jgi:hypothetical protein